MHSVLILQQAVMRQKLQYISDPKRGIFRLASSVLPSHSGYYLQRKPCNWQSLSSIGLGSILVLLRGGGGGECNVFDLTLGTEAVPWKHKHLMSIVSQGQFIFNTRMLAETTLLWLLKKQSPLLQQRNSMCLLPSVSRTVGSFSAEVLFRILLIQHPDMCEWEMAAPAIALSFPLATHVNLGDLD